MKSSSRPLLVAVEKTVVPESRVSCGVPADSVSAAELDAARKTREPLVRSCRLPPASVLTRSPEKTVAPGEAEELRLRLRAGQHVARNQQVVSAHLQDEHGKGRQREEHREKWRQGVECSVCARRNDVLLGEQFDWIGD